MMAFLQVVRCGWKSSSRALYAGGQVREQFKGPPCPARTPDKGGALARTSGRLHVQVVGYRKRPGSAFGADPRRIFIGLAVYDAFQGYVTVLHDDADGL